MSNSTVTASNNNVTPTGNIRENNNPFRVVIILPVTPRSIGCTE